MLCYFCFRDFLHLYINSILKMFIKSLYKQIRQYLLYIIKRFPNKMTQLHFLQRYIIQKKQPNHNQTLLTDKINNKLVLMKQIEVGGYDDFKRMVEVLETQKDLKHDHLLTLIDYKSTNQTLSQGTKRKIVIFYEYCVQTLQNQIEVRIKENRPFDQTQMWSLICSPVLGLSYLQKHNIGHGCISISDIFLTPEGVIKVCDPSIASSSPFQFSENYYYSPEFLASYTEQDISMIDSLDIYKADIFSLAMCALSAGLLQDCTDCYVYNQGYIDEKLIQEKLQKLSQYYSQGYIKVLIAMLDFNVQTRPNFIQLQECLVQLLNIYIKSEDQNQEEGYLENASNVKFLCRPSPTIQFTKPDQEDQGNILNKKCICNDVSQEKEVIDINEDAKPTQQQLETKMFLKSASQSIARHRQSQNSFQKKQSNFDLPQDNSYLTLKSHRLSNVSNQSQLQQTYKYQRTKPKNTLFKKNNESVYIQQTSSKQNLDNANLMSLVKRNSKSIILQNVIPMTGSKVSCPLVNYKQNSYSVPNSLNNSMLNSQNSSMLFTDSKLMERVKTDMKKMQLKPKVKFIRPPYQ